MAHALSKSRFQLGLQCDRQLWLKCHRPEVADPLTESQLHIFGQGTRVGELARERFAGGVLVAEGHTQSTQALATTRRLMAEPPPALFEAAFSHAGVFVRPDALVRNADGSWDLYEVKSTTKLKDEHISDVAVQLWVLEGCGLKIRDVFLMHLDNTYVHPGGPYVLDRLFTAEDVTAAARAFLPAVPDLVSEMLAMLEGAEPSTRIGKHCDKPYTCGFYGYCHANLPARPVTALPRISGELLDGLLDAGILAIDDVPRLFPGLTAPQREVCELVRSGEPRVDAAAARMLGKLVWPVHFLDFETMMPALPLYAGTRPWQQVPFQWSDHVLHADGTVLHREFLHDSDGDPRPAFAGSLLAALGRQGSVVVYSPFERSRLSELAVALPEHAEAIGSVQRRLFDLEKVVRSCVHHPACLGRTSIKAVLPALVDTLSYAGLAIHEGGTASLRYQRCAQGELASDERAELFEDLRAYCATDTLAMVELYRVLTGRPTVAPA